jgi:hypothetical protein
MKKSISTILLLSLIFSITAPSVSLIDEEMEQWTIEIENEEERNEQQIELEDCMDEYWTNTDHFKSAFILKTHSSLVSQINWNEFREALTSPPPESRV